MKTILIIKLLITLSIFEHLKVSPNFDYSKLDIELVKSLVQNKLKVLFSAHRISDLLHLVGLILSEITEGNLNFKNHNKSPILNSLDFANSISLEISVDENKLNSVISSDDSNKSGLVILQCLKKLINNNDEEYTDFPISIYFNSLSDRLLILKQLKNRGGIYCWYSKQTGKMYVGSAVNLRARTNDYYQASYVKDRKHFPIIRAMEKYGRDNFSLIILEYTNKENLLRSEQYWIDSITPSYNILTVAGSWSNHHHTEDAKLKMSKARIGKTHTEEVKKLMSLSRRKENNSFFGKTHSQETKDLLSAYRLLRTSDPNPGFLVDLYSSDNKLLASFKSIREAAKHFKADTRTINRYLNSNKLFRGEYYLRNKDI